MRDVASELPIGFDGVGVAFGGRVVLERVSMELRNGAPTVLIGPNGSGKTTFMRLASGLMAPTMGRITYAGRTSARADRYAFVLQKPVMLRRSTAANVAYALTAAGRRAEPPRIQELLELVGLPEHAGRPARRLSGGEQQRLALARALAVEPEVLFLDEPTASLDPASALLIEEIVGEVQAQGMRVVLVTHDVGQA
ncbi:MAG: ATP-binding cassette domain-containing protein, partial [Hyphomicrobiaceae bacterium]|nr:ATP-binding cassette domain-containing protein [Hyphomicrobiaceae bacterium]